MAAAVQSGESPTIKRLDSHRASRRLRGVRGAFEVLFD